MFAADHHLAGDDRDRPGQRRRRGVGDTSRFAERAENRSGVFTCAITDEERRSSAKGVEQDFRTADNRRLHFAAIFIQRREDLPTPRIYPHRDASRLGRRAFQQIPTDPCQSIEAGDTDERLPLGEREPLHRRDTDAQSGERPGSSRNCEHIDLG